MLRTLRHLWLPTRSDGVDGARARTQRRYRWLRKADGRAARPRARRSEERGRSASRTTTSRSSRQNFSATIFSRPKRSSKPCSGKARRRVERRARSHRLYAEMGGQVGDHGLLHVPGHDRTEVGRLAVLDTQKRGNVFIHRAKVTEGRAPEPGEAVRSRLMRPARRDPATSHRHASCCIGRCTKSFRAKRCRRGVTSAPDKLTFDFSSAALTPEQVREVEKLVNERIAENASGFVDGNSLRRSEEAFGYSAILRRQIRRHRPRRADRRHGLTS